MSIGHSVNSQEWFEKKIQDYHHGLVEVLSEYTGSEKPIRIVYHCPDHGDTYTTINAKNICKPYFLPCKKCQSIRKSNSSKKTDKKNKQFYYNRLAKYCEDRGGKVLELQWTKAKDLYHFKCGVPDHPVFVTSADALYSGEHWCPYCSGRSGDFKTELETICKEKNGELISDYNGAGEYVTVKCNKHNYVWNILPSNIKKGRWCPICNMGFNEKVVYDYLVNMHCNFKIQYTFDDLVGDNNEKLRFDFAVFSPNNSLICLIEIDDEEHKDDHSGNTPRQIRRQKAVKRDAMKNEYCKDNNIALYRMQVPFRNFNKWGYDDYYKYVSIELKDIIETAMKEIKC